MASDPATHSETSAARAGSQEEIVLSVRDVAVEFAGKKVLDGLSLDVKRGEILGFVGASGAGKSVLLRTILGLNRKQSGTIKLFDIDLDKASELERMHLDMRSGVLFQHGALFSALTVQENVQVPMREYLEPAARADGRTRPAQGRAGRIAARCRHEISVTVVGGMVKRAALARALALDPEIVFLDEPTSGLDPISAAELDELVGKLRDTMGLTVYMVTDELDSLVSVCDRIVKLGDKKSIGGGHRQRHAVPTTSLGESLIPWQAGAPARPRCA